MEPSPQAGKAVARAFAVKPASRLGQLFHERRGRADAAAAFASIVAEVDGPSELVSELADGLPAGPALAEAVVARSRLRAISVEWGEPVVVSDLEDLLEICRARGSSSVEVMRADPSLVPHLQIGSWFEASWQFRLARRATCRLERLLARAATADARALELAIQAAFWAGVRNAATDRELARLTRSSYVALYYHRIATDSEDERLHVPPEVFRRQIRLLRLLRFRPLSPGEQLAFHAAQDAVLPRRSYVLTADDAFADAAHAFAAVADYRPQLFVPTGLVGREVPWEPSARVAGWEELEQTVARGVAIGSHSRTHRVLPSLSSANLVEELAGSLSDLDEHLSERQPILAYPHGRHDAATREAAAAAGYQAAYGTTPGRNGAGSDPLQLRRIGVKAWDGSLSFLWKVVTGAHLPARWERRRLERYRRASRRPGAPAPVRD